MESQTIILGIHDPSTSDSRSMIHRRAGCQSKRVVVMILGSPCHVR